MSAKKEIKIQTDSKDANTKVRAAEAVDKDKQDPKSEPEKVDQEQVNDPPEDLAEKLKSKALEAQENYDRLLRNSAEFENYKKRVSREMEEFESIPTSL